VPRHHEPDQSPTFGDSVRGEPTLDFQGRHVRDAERAGHPRLERRGTVDKPLLDSNGPRVESFNRVETFGDHAFGAAQEDWDTNDVHWVKVLVDPHSQDVFAFQPQTVSANRVAVPSP
jgi:hypothetical protein